MLSFENRAPWRAQALLADLDERRVDVRSSAIAKLLAVVDHEWAEIASAIASIETLSEDDSFAERASAAMLASKVRLRPTRRPMLAIVIVITHWGSDRERSSERMMDWFFAKAASERALTRARTSKRELRWMKTAGKLGEPLANGRYWRGS